MNDPMKPGVYEAGTLRYTRGGVGILFVWLLWGDFAFTFFESIFGKLLPLYLKDLEASNALIGIMTGSIAGLMNIIFLPNISRWSDGYRCRWGRRIPFLLAATPLTVTALILVGFAPELGTWAHLCLPDFLAPAVSKTTLILGLLCLFVVAFHFFNMILVNSYNWLLRDVVPQELMAGFLSWFRVVGMASTFLFLWFVFPHVISHRREVCTGVGIFYFLSFLLMCRNVKEGEYPVSSKPSQQGVIRSFVLYFRECLTIPLYRNFFIANVLVSIAATCAGPFSVLFARNTLGLNMEDMGKIFAWGTGVSAILFVPMGWLCDRVGPLAVALTALGIFFTGSVLAFLLVRGQSTYFVYTLAVSLPGVAWSLGQLAATMKIFPSEKFGQFASALNVFACGALIPANFLIGRFMDLMNSNYRMAFLWSAIFYALAIIPMILVIRGWKKHGGPNYVAPLPK